MSTSTRKLKNVHILATGGTIAGVASSKTQTVGYKAASLSVESLLEAVPDINNIARITAEQFCQLASENMDNTTWLAIVKRVNTILANPDIDGIVITHGTDTLEETAYLLHLSVQSKKPVVLVGAMRPATAISADGPLNLYNAVLVAANDNSQAKGVLVVMEDIILSGRDARKTSTYRTNTFMGADYGTLGTIQGGTVEYYYAPVKKHTYQSEFNLNTVQTLPKVNIIYLHVDCGSEMLDLAIKNKSQGIIVAGIGNGSFNHSICEYIQENHLDNAHSIPIIRSSRVAGGAVARNGEVDDDMYFTIPANDLSPQKARILLMLGITQKASKSELTRMFMEY